MCVCVCVATIRKSWKGSEGWDLGGVRGRIGKGESDVIIL